ncbi:ABC transporter substrate-binding protein [Roseiarcus sp.]|uniref:ABC transporter substrate-binding protein n=1 Tax=Roseiarcus sp. TaxID=1969460 RepID=UPI003F961241
MTRRAPAAIAAFALWGCLIATGAASAEFASDRVRIGVLTDESGPYADSAGPGAILAAKMAAEDFGGAVKGHKIEIVDADTQNKPDVAAAIARRWYDAEGVNAIVDLPVTPVAFAVQEIARQKNRTVMITASAASEFTTKACSPISSHWADDTHALAAGTAKALSAEGGKNWFFITVDIAFGKALQEAATQVIEAAGGKVIGSVRHPVGASDFSSLILQAQASGADIIGLASVGGDLVNILKTANEFGVGHDGNQTLAGFLVYIDDVNALGLDVAKGLYVTTGFYWDQNDEARAFARRFFEQRHAMPSKDQAEVYVAVKHYLQAMDAAGTDDAVAVNKAMRAAPVDYFGKKATIREDGRVLYDLTLYRVKGPADMKAPWDYYAPLRTIPADEAFLPINKDVVQVLSWAQQFLGRRLAGYPAISPARARAAAAARAISASMPSFP